MSEKITFPEPHEVLKEKPSFKKYLKYLLFFGPGAILASMTIGQGQLILGPQIGAWAGYGLMWLITLNLASYIFCYVGCRFTLLSGISIMDVFSIKTSKGWFNWLLIVIILIFIPMFTASIITTIGQTLSWILGSDPNLYIIWGVIACLIAGVLVITARYRFLEHIQAFFVVVLGVGAVISAIFIFQKFNPDFFEIISGFFAIGNMPSYPDWALNFYEQNGITPTNISLLSLGFLGTLTISIIPLVGYIGWIKVKKWGIFKDKKDPDAFSKRNFENYRAKGKISYLPNSAYEIRKSKILLKPLIVDLSIAFFIVSIVSAAYIISGKFLLGPQNGEILLPSDVDLIRTQAAIFTQWSVWLEPLYKISVFFALFGTIYAGFEAVTRMLHETSKNVFKRINKISYVRFMSYLMFYILVLGIPLSILIYKGFSVMTMLSITLLFIGVVGVILYGIGSVYLTQRILPKEYRLNYFSLFIIILLIILFLVPFFIIFI